MWNEVTLLLVGVLCLCGAYLNIRYPERVASGSAFRWLTVAGLVLPQRAARVWIQFLGVILLVLGGFALTQVFGQLWT